MLELFGRLLDRDGVRTEAEVQADVRQLLLAAPWQLDEGDVRIVSLETPLGDRRRIDVETGSAVIEVKRDLRKGRVREEAVEQLAGYVTARTQQSGHRYTGILTDGVEWRCYDLQGDELHEVTFHVASAAADGLQRLLIWLEGVLATASGIAPTGREISARLGAQSSAHQLDYSALLAIYQANSKLPSLRIKRALWSKLLTSSLGTQFEDTDKLFVEHTLLVNMAEIIAHCVLGLNPKQISARSLLTGDEFDRSGIYGVVEEDFFDWIIEVPEGASFVQRLAKRISSFDWAAVSEDVLKVLYESVIGADTRKRLGEYYTPDWLASVIVNDELKLEPSERVLDPACGSGTFLFHTIRRYKAIAAASGIPVRDALATITKNVIGMDLHPVAVTFARVTYLLALGTDMLMDGTRGSINVPVYLGDSIQWNEQATTLWTAKHLVVPVEDKAELFATELKFPEELIDDASTFDDLIKSLATSAASRKSATIPSLDTLFKRLGIETRHHEAVTAAFKTMCNLHDQGRDHIWSYYVRNVARPLWLSQDTNKVDCLIGNPPWLAFRHMPEEMQTAFRRMSDNRGLWAGGENATHQDLSALFAARAIELYLGKNGRFAFVMPNAVIDRQQYAGFRTGTFSSGKGDVWVSFRDPWDLKGLRPHFFPRGSSVIIGAHSSQPKPMPEQSIVFTGRLVPGAGLQGIERNTVKVKIRPTEKSPYSERFRQGATIVPRMFFYVERRPAGPLGTPAGLVPVRSLRSANEKKPWKDLPTIEGVIEQKFIRPMFSGENLLPFRLGEPLLGIVPVEQNKVMETEGERAAYPGLGHWWRQAEDFWIAHRSSERLSLVGQLDYMSKLSGQLPPPPLRVVYNKSGMHVAASVLEDPAGVCTNNLYWCAVRSMAEAHYLCAILNSPVVTELTRPFMSYAKDERDIHKHVWNLPIQEFDQSNSIHQRISAIGAELASIAQAVSLDSGVHFSAQRRAVRDAIAEAAVSAELDEVLFEVLS